MVTIRFSSLTTASMPFGNFFLDPSSSTSASVSTISNGINFTLSISAHNNGPGTTISNALASDRSGTGIRAQIGMGPSVTHSATIVLSMTTTSNRTAFTTNATLNGELQNTDFTASAAVISGAQITFTTTGISGSTNFVLNNIITNFTCIRIIYKFIMISHHHITKILFCLYFR